MACVTPAPTKSVHPLANPHIATTATAKSAPCPPHAASGDNGVGGMAFTILAIVAILFYMMATRNHVP
jgi:hypothetical protein